MWMKKERDRHEEHMKRERDRHEEHMKRERDRQDKWMTEQAKISAEREREREREREQERKRDFEFFEQMMLQCIPQLIASAIAQQTYNSPNPPNAAQLGSTTASPYKTDTGRECQPSEQPSEIPRQIEEPSNESSKEPSGKPSEEPSKPSNKQPNKEPNKAPNESRSECNFELQNFLFLHASLQELVKALCRQTKNWGALSWSR